MSQTEPSAFTERLVGYIATEVASADDPIDAETDLLLTGLVDSLGVILIVNWMEDELGISIDPVDVVLENFQFVHQMVAYAQRREAVAPA